MEHTISSIGHDSGIEVFLLAETLTDDSVVYNVSIQIPTLPDATSIKSTQYTSQKEAELAMSALADELSFFELEQHHRPKWNAGSIPVWGYNVNLSKGLDRMIWRLLKAILWGLYATFSNDPEQFIEPEKSKEIQK